MGLLSIAKKTRETMYCIDRLDILTTIMYVVQDVRKNIEFIMPVTLSLIML